MAWNELDGRIEERRPVCYLFLNRHTRRHESKRRIHRRPSNKLETGPTRPWWSARCWPRGLDSIDANLVLGDGCRKKRTHRILRHLQRSNASNDDDASEDPMV